jgi:hypothetical protein
MSPGEARGRIELELQPDSAPELTIAEVDAIAAEAGFRQPDGSTGYSLRGVYRALALGWRVKCAKIAADVDVKADVVEARKSQAADRCARAIAQYVALAAATPGFEFEPDAQGAMTGGNGSGLGSVGFGRGDRCGRTPCREQERGPRPL